MNHNPPYQIQGTFNHNDDPGVTPKVFHFDDFTMGDCIDHPWVIPFPTTIDTVVFNTSGFSGTPDFDLNIYKNAVLADTINLTSADIATVLATSINVDTDDEIGLEMVNNATPTTDEFEDMMVWLYSRPPLDGVHYIRPMHRATLNANGTLTGTTDLMVDDSTIAISSTLAWVSPRALTFDKCTVTFGNVVNGSPDYDLNIYKNAVLADTINLLTADRQSSHDVNITLAAADKISMDIVQNSAAGNDFEDLVVELTGVSWR